MSITDTLKAKVAPKSPSPATIANELSLAEGVQSELEAQHGTFALDSLAGASGADAKLKDLEQKLSAQRQRVVTLKAAHAAAIKREQDEIARQRAVIQRSQYNALKKHVETRDRAATDLAKAIADAAQAYRQLQTASAKAMAACPVGSKFPSEESFWDHVIRRLTENEMWRSSAAPGDKDKLALPGAAFGIVGHLTSQWDPSATPPLEKVIQEGSQRVLAVLKPKAPLE